MKISILSLLTLFIFIPQPGKTQVRWDNDYKAGLKELEAPTTYLQIGNQLKHNLSDELEGYSRKERVNAILAQIQTAKRHKDGVAVIINNSYLTEKEFNLLSERNGDLTNGEIKKLLNILYKISIKDKEDALETYFLHRDRHNAQMEARLGQYQFYNWVRNGAALVLISAASASFLEDINTSVLVATSTVVTLTFEALLRYSRKKLLNKDIPRSQQLTKMFQKEWESFLKFHQMYMSLEPALEMKPHSKNRCRILF